MSLKKKDANVAASGEKKILTAEDFMSKEELKAQKKAIKARNKRVRAQRAGRHARSTGGNIAIFIILVAFGAFFMLPFFFTIMQAFKPAEELFRYPPRLIPRNPTIDNFIVLGQLTNSLWVPLSRYITNSVLVSVLGTGLHVIVASMGAFVLSKYKFPGSTTFFTIIVYSLLFTGSVTAMPSFIVMNKLHLINTPLAIIIPAVGGSFGLFLMKQFMEQIHPSIIESATIDGAGTFKIFTSIVMPSVKPAWLTLIIFTFQSLWNSTGGTYIYDEAWKMLPTVLSQITASGIARSGAAAAASVIMIIPPLLVFILTQSNVIETMAYSGIKE